MTTPKLAKGAIVAITLIVLLLTQTTAGQLSTTQTISISGTIITPTTSAITVTPSNVIGTNKLTLGTQLTFYDTENFPTDSQAQTLMNDAGIKLVRLFDSDYDAIDYPFVLSWNEGTHTGTYDWTKIDAVIEAIYASGAEPLVVLMSNMANSASSWSWLFSSGIPNDNSLNGLPSVADAVSYVSAFVAHMQSQGYPVKYYEIGNEINTWICQGGWTQELTEWDGIKAGDFATIYNACVTAMKAITSTVSVSFDFAWQTGMMSWWLANYTGTPLDRIDFHRYDSGTAGEMTDADAFHDAQLMIPDVGPGTTGFWGSSNNGNNPIYAQNMYFASKGVTLPLFDTESNMCSEADSTDEPRMVQMAGAVFAALLLKTEALNNIGAHIYFTWASSLSYEQSLSPPSYGFGLIEGNNHQPYYPYYVYQMIGNNLQVGDPIVSTSSNTRNIVSFTWMDKGNLNILLINTFNSTVSTTVSGATGNFNYEKIDNTYSSLNAKLQTGSLSLSSPIIMNGYTVILLTSTPTPHA
jgi:hypothetical protein